MVFYRLLDGGGGGDCSAAGAPPGKTPAGPGTPPPRAIADFVALHARRRPDHPAIISADHITSYRALQREIAAMTAALAGLALAPGALVAVAHPDLRVRLLILLAGERLGVTVAPFRRDEGHEAAALLAEAELVMAPVEITDPPCRRSLALTPDWLAQALSQPPRATLRVGQPDDAVLLVRTSGSTGTPKQMLVTRAMLAARTRRRAAALDLHRTDRFLATAHFTIAVGLYLTLLHLKLGATVVASPELDIATAAGLPAALARSRPTCMHLLPFHLAALLNGSTMLDRQPQLTLVVSGGKLAPALREQAINRLCGRVLELYGSNETSMVCLADGDTPGTPLPGVTVDVVDEDGMKLAPGEVGEIRVSGASVVAGYRADPAATAAAFRAGWYYTGDFGTLTADGRLQVLGRRDEVLNFGGIKRPASVIEAQIQSRCHGHDFAVLAGEDADGAPTILICIACSEAELALLAAPLRTFLQDRCQLHRVDAIPRAPDGKLRRMLLQQHLAAARPVTAVSP